MFTLPQSPLLIYPPNNYFYEKKSLIVIEPIQGYFEQLFGTAVGVLYRRNTILVY